MKRVKTLKAKQRMARQKVRAAMDSAFANIGHHLSEMLIDRVFPQHKIDRVEADRVRLRAALQEIADHHEEQRECWSTEETSDEDQARYHEERRNLVLWHLAHNCEVSGLEQGREAPLATGRARP